LIDRKVYDLCTRSIAKGHDIQKSSEFLEELDKTLHEGHGGPGAHGDIEQAAEGVFKVKILLALESRYEDIVLSNGSRK
jgi:hypothetical protein